MTRSLPLVFFFLPLLPLALFAGGAELARQTAKLAAEDAKDKGARERDSLADSKGRR